MDIIFDIFTIIVAIVGGLATMIGAIYGIIKYIRKPILEKLTSMDTERTNAQKQTDKQMRALKSQMKEVLAGNLILCEALMQHDSNINGKVKLFKDKYSGAVFKTPHSELEDDESIELIASDLDPEDDETLTL